jgi:hypothetical protein
VLDVHSPHEPIHGWRDFFVHLTTITIGLVIALSLEGCVEWQHHRHLVHEAEAGLQIEIKANAKEVQGALDNVRKELDVLKQDAVVLKKIIANPKVPNNEEMTINFRIQSFGDVSWRTAQSTGALSYMPYEQAHAYSVIYAQQNEVYTAEEQAIRDTVVSVAPFLNSKKGDQNPGAEEAVKIKDRLEILQGQLLLLEDHIQELGVDYKKFLAAHPE